MNKTIIITLANQKGGVGKTTLCTLFANYLVAKGKSVIVVDCDGQQTIYEKRQADRKKYSDEQVKYNIQAFSIANIDNVRNLMKNLRQMPGVVLIDAPGNLAQQGLIPLFAQTDYIVCPYQYEITSINSTVVFVRFILRLKNEISSMKTKLFFVVNKFDKRYGTEGEKKLWTITDEKLSMFGNVTPKIDQKAEMQRYNTMGLMFSQKSIVGPALLVLDVRGQQAQSSSNEPTLAEKEVAEPSEAPAPTTVRRKPRVKKEPKKTAMPIEGNPLWNAFLKFGESYDFQVRKDNRKGYWVDEDIVATLKMCDINRLSVADKINAILRAFIELNKDELRDCVKHRKSLI